MSCTKSVCSCLIVVFLSSLVTGCSQTETENKNIVAIQTVLEHEFNAPEEDNELNTYLEDNLKPYFTDFGYRGKVLFLTLHSPADNNGYQIAVDKIDVEPVKGRLRDYDFTVHETYQRKDGEKMKTEITGLATCPDEGKIGKIRYNKDYFLFEDILRGK